MIYGLDSAFPPSVTGARLMYSNGWRFYGGYIGGPRAYNRWLNSDFGQLALIGFKFLPIFVGRNRPWDTVFNYDAGIADGDAANNLAGGCGFNETQPLVLDVEYGTWDGQAVTDYCDGWCNRVHMPGHTTILYSDPATIAAIGSHFDYTWGADYVTSVRYGSPPAGQFDPSTPPPWDVWQFDDNGAIGGSTVDLNSARDDFPFATYQAP